MVNAVSDPLAPRKAPRQARSAATVAVLFEATIQVLQAVGLEGLTTTRVAERAGVSVGTLYQYFPNKRALLRALIERYLDGIAQGVARAAAAVTGRPLAAQVEAVCAAYLDAKTADLAATRVLYPVTSSLDGDVLIAAVSARLRRTLSDLLSSASDRPPARPEEAAFVWVVVLAGSVQNALQSGADGAQLALLARELPRLCRLYLDAAAGEAVSA